ncbi:MAG: sigma-70 family RNA polymerase sigma factor [Actinomycetota bacterium]|nr:sigma-70 family RNA polymerase sigma factor [Actinomycetota bacterium]
METAELRNHVRRAARGDEEAAGLLFDHYYPRVFRYARGKLGRDADAEDVAAETFARVLRGLDRFKWKGAGFEAWLFRIASNLVVDAHRRSSRETVEAAPAEQAVPPGELPETLVMRAQSLSVLTSMLDRLPADQREVILLRFGADLDTNEVGRVMGRNANAVRQLQFRALQSLRTLTQETRA